MLGPKIRYVNAVNDSLIELLLCQRSDLDINEDRLFFRLQHDRIHSGLQSLEKSARGGDYQEWDYVSMALYSLIDWMDFRKLGEISAYPALKNLRQNQQARPGISESDPRLGSG